MRRMLLAAGAAGLVISAFGGVPALASGCEYTAVAAPGNAAVVFVDDDFPTEDALGVWIYADFNGDGEVTRDDEGCDSDNNPDTYSDEWVF